MQLSRVIYFSLDEIHIELFKDRLKESRSSYEASFKLVSHPGFEHGYNHASDLVFMLDHLEKDGCLSDLYVIVDYISLLKHEKRKTSYDSFARAADIVRRAILKFPEVFFLFEEEPSTNYDFSDFLFDEIDVRDKVKKRDSEAFNRLWKKYHQFYWWTSDEEGDTKNPFEAIVRRRSIMFDGSNLRYLLKLYLYQKLSVKSMNFELFQDKRRAHLAVCVEEERSQARFNGYVLYSCGYRVLPVSCASELKCLNDEVGELSERENTIVVRDYDLQFPDAVPDRFGYDEASNDLKLVDLIRGAKKFDENDAENWKGKKTIAIGEKTYAVGDWHVPDRDGNPFWSNLLGYPQYFISKGKDGIRFCFGRDEKSIGYEFVDHIKEQVLVGVTKPVNGIYDSILQFEKVRNLFPFSDNERKRFTKGDRIPLNTNREGHSHGVPLDIYDLVKSMVDRAENYYGKEKYLLAAIVSGEAIEILNGFHESLMLKAYHIHAKSENALAMNLLGGDESSLKKDAVFRIDMIKEDVNWMLQGNKDNVDNILNQIFSDCRQFCKQREHFEAEEAFVSAMGHINDGLDLYQEIRDFLNKEVKDETTEWFTDRRVF